jgi:hypothetical protein
MSHARIRLLLRLGVSNRLFRSDLSTDLQITVKVFLILCVKVSVTEFVCKNLINSLLDKDLRAGRAYIS